MRIMIETNGTKIGESNLDSDDPRLLGAAVRMCIQRLQEVAQRPGLYVLTMEVTDRDIERTNAKEPTASAPAIAAPAAAKEPAAP